MDALSRLVDQAESWSTTLGWDCRRIKVKIRDSRFGEYEALGLIMQKEETRLRIEPVSGNVIGADGVVDLYVLPAYDDLASLYLKDGNWSLNYLWRHSKPVAGELTQRDAPAEPLTQELFTKVIEEMAHYARSA